jgi:hypothetical protein
VNDDGEKCIADLANEALSPFQRRASFLRIQRDFPERILEAASLAAQDPDRSNRREAAKVLASIPGPGCEEILSRLLKDPERDVRAEAARALETVGGVRSAGELSRLLKDEDAGVRSAAQRALLTLEKKGLVFSLTDTPDSPPGPPSSGTHEPLPTGPGPEEPPSPEHPEAKGEEGTPSLRPSVFEVLADRGAAGGKGEPDAPPLPVPGNAGSVRPPDQETVPREEIRIEEYAGRGDEVRREFIRDWKGAPPPSSEKKKRYSESEKTVLKLSCLVGFLLALFLPVLVFLLFFGEGKEKDGSRPEPVRHPRYSAGNPAREAEILEERKRRRARAREAFEEAEARFREGKTKEALELASSALRLLPGFWEAYRLAGVVLYVSGDFDGAAYHFRQSFRIGSPKPEDERLSLLFFVAEAQSPRGDPTPLFQRMVQALPGRKVGEEPAARLYTGDATPAEVWGALESEGTEPAPDAVCRTAFFVAAFHLFGNQRELALRELRRAAATNATGTLEYYCAVADLRRLEAGGK